MSSRRSRPVAPIDYVPQINCPMLGIFGNEDQAPTPSRWIRSKSRLKKNGKQYEFHRYDGAGPRLLLL